ncbi:hypothetical protein [Actinomycetospora cinnamomea]|uniref:Uncharacterized protein n=1 Tax=Actinomycetospora cinnamomea TaxID=663609 RepID=A0A2U1FFS6_9PSEU|nr:hypothetical protein [Actinomycetospora cinnamomea]PVZ11043.1 hypothetical protein C8D89_104257 [Actinomycetospora cinnamomea]
MDDQERYARFLSALGFRAGVGTAPEGVDLTDLDGEPVEPAVRLHVCAQRLAEHVRDEDGLVPSARESLDEEPDELDDPEAARLQTLLAQIEEAILVREPGHDHLVLVDGGVRAVSSSEVG